MHVKKKNLFGAILNLFIFFIILLQFIFCSNPQLSEEINNDSRLYGKWIKLETNEIYNFGTNGRYDLIDSNHLESIYSTYTEHYATYFDTYLNVTYRIGQITFFGNPNRDTIILFDACRKYHFIGDTLIFERGCFLFSGSSSSLVGNWTQLPLRQYLVDNNYIYNDPGSKYMNFGSDGFLDSDLNWFPDSFPSPYPYVDHSTYFEFHTSISDSFFVNIDYVIHDSLLVLLWPPYEKDSTADFSPDTLIREK